MAGGDKTPIPRFPPGKIILLRGSTANRIMDLLARGRVRPGKNVTVDVTPTGTFINALGGGAAADANCPFADTYIDGTAIMLRGGVVTGGEGSITVSDTSIGTVSSPPADETQVWLEVSFSAAEVDDVLMPGGDATSASIGSGSTIPSNDLPTAASTSGTLYIPLGDWMDDTFRPAGCGNFQIAHCPGTLSYIRG